MSGGVEIVALMVWLAQAGTVTGTVIDDRTGQPITAVQISVERQSITAETDASGRFTVTVPRGRQTIAASVIGYAVHRVGLASRRVRWRSGSDFTARP